MNFRGQDKERSKALGENPNQSAEDEYIMNLQQQIHFMELELKILKEKVIEDEKYSPLLNRKYTIADMCTGYGVAQAVKHYYELWGNGVSGKRAVVQGWGNVGAAAGFYLAQMGAKVVGIIDIAGGLIKEEGNFIKREEDKIDTLSYLPIKKYSLQVIPDLIG